MSNNDDSNFGGFFPGLLCAMSIWGLIMILMLNNRESDERINKICVEAKYKKYQLDMCDKYSDEFKSGVVAK